MMFTLSELRTHARKWAPLVNCCIDNFR